MEDDYIKGKYRQCLSEKQSKSAEEKAEKLDQGWVTIPYLNGFSEISKNIVEAIHGRKQHFNLTNLK